MVVNRAKWAANWSGGAAEKGFLQGLGPISGARGAMIAKAPVFKARKSWEVIGVFSQFWPYAGV